MIGRFRHVLDVTIACVLLLFVGTTSSALTVKVDGGRVEGTMENGLRVYRGIPFAAPPVGDLRWREPQPVKPWQGILKALKFGPPCMQASGPPTAGNSPSEDCLYLNIWSPATKVTERLPILV